MCDFLLKSKESLGEIGVFHLLFYFFSVFIVIDYEGLFFRIF